MASIFGNHIRIDASAAGNGWYVDPALADDDEFTIAGPGNSAFAEDGTDAYGRYDLLTVLMHEMGHALGIGHQDAPGTLLNRNLQSSSRINITDWEVDQISFDSLDLNFDIGTTSDREKIQNGLTEFADWASDQRDEILDGVDVDSLPFISGGLASFFSDLVDDVADGIGTEITTIISDEFADKGDLTSDDIVGLDEFSFSDSNTLTEFSADIRVVTDLLELDLEEGLEIWSGFSEGSGTGSNERSVLRFFRNYQV